jgi:hypothetical protein
LTNEILSEKLRNQFFNLHFMPGNNPPMYPSGQATPVDLRAQYLSTPADEVSLAKAKLEEYKRKLGESLEGSGSLIEKDNLIALRKNVRAFAANCVTRASAQMSQFMPWGRLGDEAKKIAESIDATLGWVVVPEIGAGVK